MRKYNLNYYSNFFHVKDSNQFCKMIFSTLTTNEELSVFEDDDNKGSKIYSFGGYYEILGLVDDDDNISYDLFINKLQEHIVDGEAIILISPSSVTIITSENITSHDIRSYAISKAREQLGSNYTSTFIE